MGATTPVTHLFIGAPFDSRWQGLRVEADDVGYSCAIASCRDSWEMAMAPWNQVVKLHLFFYFHPGFVGFHDTIWFTRIFFKWVGEKPPTREDLPRTSNDEYMNCFGNKNTWKITFF